VFENLNSDGDSEPIFSPFLITNLSRLVGRARRRFIGDVPVLDMKEQSETLPYVILP